MTKNTPYELSLVVLVKNWFYIIMASEKCAGKFFLPGRVPGRVPGCAGSFRLVPRSKKTVSRSEKHKSISQTWYTRYSTGRLFVGIFFTFREFILILHGAV